MLQQIMGMMPGLGPAAPPPQAGIMAMLQQMMALGMGAGLMPGLGAAAALQRGEPQSHPLMQASDLALYDAAARMKWVTLLRPWPGGGRSPWRAEVPAGGPQQQAWPESDDDDDDEGEDDDE